MNYAQHMTVVLWLLSSAFTLSGCGGGSTSGDGMDTGSVFSAEIAIPLAVNACENTIHYADVTFTNQDLPVLGAGGTLTTGTTSGNTGDTGVSGTTGSTGSTGGTPQTLMHSEPRASEHHRQGATGETGIIHTSRQITIDRYTIEYIPIDPLSPPLSAREYFQTLPVPPNSRWLFTNIHFLDGTTKQEFRSFTLNNPGITSGRYSVVYRFHCRTDLGREVVAAATASFHIVTNCP